MSCWSKGRDRYLLHSFLQFFCLLLTQQWQYSTWIRILPDCLFVLDNLSQQRCKEARQLCWMNLGLNPVLDGSRLPPTQKWLRATICSVYWCLRWVDALQQCREIQIWVSYGHCFLMGQSVLIIGMAHDGKCHPCEQGSTTYLIRFM